MRFRWTNPTLRAWIWRSVNNSPNGSRCNVIKPVCSTFPTPPAAGGCLAACGAAIAGARAGRRRFRKLAADFPAKRTLAKTASPTFGDIDPIGAGESPPGGGWAAVVQLGLWGAARHRARSWQNGDFHLSGDPPRQAQNEPVYDAGRLIAARGGGDHSGFRCAGDTAFVFSVFASWRILAGKKQL